MRRIWVLAVVAAACHRGGTSEDCAIVKDDPTHAMARLSDKHKGDPAEAAEVIEKCLAPSGDDCVRLQIILPALPAMMNMPAAFKLPDAKQVGEVCKGMPAQMRRCMFPSYTLRHVDECAKVNDRIEDAVKGPISIEPKACNKPPVELAIGSDEVAVGSAHKDGPLDKDWLEATLKPYAGDDCSPEVIIKADTVRYQEMITAMDTALKIGLSDIVVGGTGSGAHHPMPAKPAGDEPIIIVTATEITFKGTSLGAPDKPATLEALGKALPATTDGVAVVQADANTASIVINRVVETLSAHGFDNVLFAVKNR